MNLKLKAGFRCSPTLRPCFSRIFLVLFLLLTVFADYLSASPAFDEQATRDTPAEPNRNTFGLYLENDYFAGTDSGYSSGLKLSWSSAVQDQYPEYAFPHFLLYPLIKHVPFEKKPDRQRNITFALGQNIFTPEDIESEELVEDDRPYAGISYLAMGFHTRLPRQMDSVEMSLGLVGPSSYAEECQKAVHRAFDDIEPQGWDNQLKNEPILGLVYEHKNKITTPDVSGGLGYDFILNTGGGIGNALTYYNLGLMFRTGWNLPNDFGVMPIRPISSFNGSVVNTDTRLSSKIGIQFFASVEGRVVLRNIFLDGNTFTDSHSVDKKPVVGDLMTGVNVNLGPGQLSFAYVTRSKEFETQHKAQKFASINLSYAY
ncbi:MAG: lipid A deacylase LpxR family protein [Desulfosalsimonadaceae bacterium]|nr:lipid A deacylase LpxR family protein [Desulfosalsimonadaceae bacterium]